MLKKLKDILNTYTDEELLYMDLWINSSTVISDIILESYSINLITSDMKINIDVDSNL